MEHTHLNNWHDTKRADCLEGTCTAILHEIDLWTQKPEQPPVYWLNGPIGTGKSTIAQTVVNKMKEDDRLGAFYFCSQESSSKNILPTLAYQLASKYPEFRLVYLTNQATLSDPQYNWVGTPFVDSLMRSGISTVIVIDALDCADKQTVSAISALRRSNSSKVKFFITSRPKPQIRECFNCLAKEDPTMFVLHNLEPNPTNNDIKLFFKHELSVEITSDSERKQCPQRRRTSYIST